MVNSKVPLGKGSDGMAVAAAMLPGILAISLGVLGNITLYQGAQLDRLQNFVESLGVWGVLAFLLISSIRPFIMIPSPLLFVLGGIVFGWFWGGAFSLLGLMTAASLSRLMAEKLRSLFSRLIKEKYLKRLIKLQGKNVVIPLFFMRITPGFPFDPISFGAGMVGIPYRGFFWGTLLGSAPKVFLYALLGEGIEGELSWKTLFVFVIITIMIITPLLWKKRYNSLE